MMDPEGSLFPIGLDIFFYIILLLIGINLTNNNKILDISFMNPQIINVSLVVPFLVELGYQSKGLYSALAKNRRYVLSGIAAYCFQRIIWGVKPFSADVRNNNWGNWFEYMVVLILIWHFLFVLGTYLTKSKFLYKIFELVSKNTLWIMALHMLALEIYKKTIFGKGFIIDYIKVAWAMIFPILVHWTYSISTKKILELSICLNKRKSSEDTSGV